MTYLILRFQSLSNVAMLVPLLESVSRLHPDDNFVVVAKKRLGDMFCQMDNVRFVEADNHTSLQNLVQLCKRLMQLPLDAVVDLQDNINTRLLRWAMRARGVKTYVIPHRRPRQGDHARYAAALESAGLHTDRQFTALHVNLNAQREIEALYGQKQGRWIGIAPFAKSKSNMLPYRVTKEVIQHFAEQPDTRVFLFGAGRIECEMLNQWARVFHHTTSVAGQLELGEELELMRKLDVMVCMDSANQHLSSLVGLRAVSVWCATHPNNGQIAWKQNEKDIIQLNHLRCRPCTLRGTNRCRYMNFACREITSKQIIKQIYE